MKNQMMKKQQFLKGSIIPSDDLEIDAMTKCKNQIIKSQEYYITNNKQPALPMYKITEIQNCDNITPPDHEVIMKSTRMKTQEKYDKLMSNAF